MQGNSQSAGGSGIPAGGTTGQVLAKQSNADGDADWDTLAGSGDVVKVGTPANNQVGVWTGDGTLEGDSALTFDTATDALTVGAGSITRVGAHLATITTTGTTGVTLPTTGTLSTLAGGETLTNKTLTTPVLSGTASGTTAGRLGYSSGALTFGDGANQNTVATANAAVTLSSNTSLDRATHGNRPLLVDTASVVLTILDDTAGGWGSADFVAGRFTATSGTMTIVNDSTGTTNTVTAASGRTLTVYPGQEFYVGREGANVWYGGAQAPDVMVLAVSDEATAITTGTAKITFRFPYAGRLVGIRGSLNTVSSSGTPTFDLNEAGTTMLSTKLTIDANELTSTTAASAAVISDAAFADDAEGTIDIDTAGTGAKGAKVALYMIRTS